MSAYQNTKISIYAGPYSVIFSFPCHFIFHTSRYFHRRVLSDNVERSAFLLKEPGTFPYTEPCQSRRHPLTSSLNSHVGAGIAQSIYRHAKGWTVRGSNPCGDEIFAVPPDRPWGLSSLLYSGYRVSFPEVKRSRRGVNHPTPSRAEVKERVELYLYSPSEPGRAIVGRILPLHLSAILTYSPIDIWSVAGIATRLRVGRSAVRPLVGTRDFSLPQNVQAGFRAHPVFYPMGTWVLSRG
jgi:hypothetical protein